MYYVLLALLATAAAFDRLQTYRQCDTKGYPGLIPRIHEVHACYASPDAPDDLRQDIVSYHIFKSGGTSVANIMNAHCNRTEQLSVWPNKRKVSNFDFPNTYTLAAVRDPVDRFLSAYHEVKKRDMERKHLLAAWGKRNYTRETEEATLEERLNRFHAFLDDAAGHVHRRKFDPHYSHQIAFLTHEGGAKVRLDAIIDIGDISNGAVYRIGRRVQGWKRATGVIKDHVFGGDDGETARSKTNPRYGVPMYIVKRHEISDLDARRIADMYKKDYECFGFDQP